MRIMPRAAPCQCICAHCACRLADQQLHPFAHAQCTSLNLVQPRYVHKSRHWLRPRLAKEHLTFQSANSGYATAVAAQLMNGDVR